MCYFSEEKHSVQPNSSTLSHKTAAKIAVCLLFDLRKKRQLAIGCAPILSQLSPDYTFL